MARYDLDLRMGIDSKLQNAELDTGALSYAVDTQNLYVDALKEDKTTIERQQINANLSYGLRNLNGIKSLESNASNYSLSSGDNSSATEMYSYAIGEGIYAHSTNYFAIGKFNYVSDNAPKEPLNLFVIGNGTSDDNRSNAFTVDLKGDTFIGGKLSVSEIINDNCSITLSNNKIVLNGPTTIKDDLIVESAFECEDATISNILTSKDINVTNNLTVANTFTSKDINVTNNLTSKDINVTNNLTVNNDKVITETVLTSTKNEIMEEVKQIADSIITKVWHRGPNPPQTVKEKDLLWIRYSKTDNTYGNGVLYYLNPSFVNKENLTDDEVKNEANWIPMSAIYY